ALEAEHLANIAKIDTEAHGQALAAQDAQYQREKQLRQTQFNEQLAEITTLEQAKTLLRETLSEEELAKIDSLEQAKEALKRQYEAEELQKQAQYLQKLVNQFTEILGQGDQASFSFSDAILTEEQKEELNARLEELKLKLSEIGLAKKEITNGGTEEGDGFGEDITSGVDIFGFTTDQWEEMFLNLEKGKAGVDEIGMAIQGLTNLWSSYSQMASSAENARLREFEES